VFRRKNVRYDHRQYYGSDCFRNKMKTSERAALTRKRELGGGWSQQRQEHLPPGRAFSKAGPHKNT